MKMASSKMYLTAVLAVILGTIFSTNAHSHVPVLLWESSSVGANGATPAALSAMEVDEFLDVLMRRLDRNSPVVALFAEDSLSVEDFSRQSSEAQSTFPALQSIKGGNSLEFFPSVQSPMKALNRLSKLGYKWEEVSGEVLPEADKKILLFNLGGLKGGEDRSQMLLRHDKTVASLFKQMVEKYSDVLAVYTGRHASWTAPESRRVRRDAEPTTTTGCNTVIKSTGNSSQIMLYTSECPVLTINGTNFNLSSGEAVGPPDTRKSLIRMVARYKVDTSSDKATLRFRFNFTDSGYWQLIQAEYEDSRNQKHLLEPTTVIKAPINFSYSCGSTATFQSADKSVSLKLKNIKVQPLMGSTRADFAASEDCVPFFTIPIWSGLFVTFLLLFIVAWGIDMMMNIHTMDRFDDPKGKPLVFNAQE
ncbi:V-type proton ATPase subunit S1 [Thrips palmi]|uniref:V-type proton ATPase subunit S1 n=1 Tax=Thrips palmi TaxID=161013 RepID=A0A6P9A7R7_THRPL|nr:V-type proton ATPase subunit S1 [Thrips palmi]